MSTTFIPKGYQPPLGLYETQAAIALIKRSFEDFLMPALNLRRVSAPLFVDPASGLNDNLNGVERPVTFDMKETGGYGEVVHSLAKWKRMALHRYGFQPGEGLYTDMNAIRRDEELDNLHSIYVDQWDWEKVMRRSDRTEEYVKAAAQNIVDCVCKTLEKVKAAFPQIKTELSSDVKFVTTQELEDLYPDLTPKERENAYLRIHHTAFIMQIGDQLKSGEKHDGRAPDYDDWTLNGDIVFWNERLGCAFEISSMGIRVDASAMRDQLKKADCMDRTRFPFHQMVLDGTMPLTMGGGIGQSRLCLLLLGMVHIGEVQSSLWDEKTKKECEAAGIILL